MSYLLLQLLALIGDYFEDSDQINGLVASSRPRYVRIALWLRDASMTEVCDRISQQWKKNLNISVEPECKPHKAT